MFEISGCEDLRDQTIRIYNHSTDLFCKDDLVELSEFPESQSAFDFTRKQSVPDFLMDLFVIRITTPPKIVFKLSIYGWRSWEPKIYFMAMTFFEIQTIFDVHILNVGC